MKNAKIFMFHQVNFWLKDIGYVNSLAQKQLIFSSEISQETIFWTAPKNRKPQMPYDMLRVKCNCHMLTIRVNETSEFIHLIQYAIVQEFVWNRNTVLSSTCIELKSKFKNIFPK